jgi:hypothetical protein
MTSTARLSILLCAAALIMACGERPQTATAATKKSDANAWEGADNRYVAQGWQEGDRASWEGQLRARTQTQNEYVKIEN